jgi:hypothetical protein
VWLEKSDNRGRPCGLTVRRKGEEASEVEGTVVLK